MMRRVSPLDSPRILRVPVGQAAETAPTAIASYSQQFKLQERAVALKSLADAVCQERIRLNEEFTVTYSLDELEVDDD